MVWCETFYRIECPDSSLWETYSDTKIPIEYFMVVVLSEEGQWYLRVLQKAKKYNFALRYVAKWVMNNENLVFFDIPPTDKALYLYFNSYENFNTFKSQCLDAP